MYDDRERKVTDRVCTYAWVLLHTHRYKKIKAQMEKLQQKKKRKQQHEEEEEDGGVEEEEKESIVKRRAAAATKGIYC